MAEKRTPGLAFIFVTLLIDVMGVGLVIPVLPKLVENLTGRGLSEGAREFGLLIAIFGLMQFLCAPVLGNLSDRFGRRPVLLVSLGFAGLDYFLQALAPTLGWLFVGRVLAGITGASFTAATAYIADVSPPEKRAQNFGMIGAAFGLGFILGPALAAQLAVFGSRAPFWAAGGLALLNFAYGFFVLPESLAPENRRPFTLRNANPFAALGILLRTRWIAYLAAAAGALWLGQQAVFSTWVLSSTYRFGWGERANGNSLALLGAASMFVQLVLIRILSARLSEAKMFGFSLVFNVIGFMAMGLAPTGLLMLIAMVVWTLSFVGGPALQGLVSRQYGEDEQGAINGAMSALMNLAGVVGPLLMTNAFGYFTAPDNPVKLPGIAFFIGAGLAAVSAGLAWYAFGRRPAAVASAA